MSPLRTGCLVISLMALAAIMAPRAFPDCSPAGGVHINEVRFADAYAPSDTHLNPLVELYNKGASSADLTGWTLTDAAGTITATLPAVILPPGAFLHVVHGTGFDDLDFSDGMGAVHTNGDSTGVYGHPSGAAALYSGAPSPATIVDFVTWGLNAVADPGVALSDAQNAGIWPGFDAVPVDAEMLYFTIRLLPDGFDNDTATDWLHYGWADSDHHANVPGGNPCQVDPQPGMGFEPGPLTFAWSTTTDPGSRYHLLVATDSTLTSGVVVSDTLDYPTADTTITLPDGVYYYRVTVLDGCGESVTGPIWEFVIFPAALPGPPPDWRPGMELAPTAAAVLGVPRRLQHKDTQLLCLWDGRPGAANTRPGCTEAAGNNGPWDNAHPANHAERNFEVNFLGRTIKWTVQCPHCRNYCARAATQSLNHFYGGNLSQDRISHQFMSTAPAGWTVASPEGDLGHDRTTPVAGVITVTQWALINSVMTGPFRPASYANLKAEIQAGFPVRISQPGHASLVDGFADKNNFFGVFPPFDMVHIVDPWPTSRTNGWRARNRVNIIQYWRLRSVHADSVVTGRNQEASVTTDSDGDGVMDFDEGYPDYPAHKPRRFHSRADVSDTDKDEVNDKQEIRSYTFHDSDHAGHENNPLAFPDGDGDGLRAELDCDSDGDKDFDGGEDINGNGAGPEGGETCVYTTGDHNIKIVMDKGVYTVGESHKMNGETFHASSTYEYFVYNSCPHPLTAEDDIVGFVDNGLVTSNPGGVFPETTIGSYAPGCYSVIIDVLKDDLYGVEVDKPSGGTKICLCDIETEFTVEDLPTPVNAFLEGHGTSDGGAHLAWNLPDSPPELRLERSASEHGPFVPIQLLTDVPPRGSYVDRHLPQAGTYWYRLVATLRDETLAAGPVPVQVNAPPMHLAALRNPIAGSGSFLLTLPGEGRVQVAVYSVDGRRVRTLLDEERGMGVSMATWDGRDEGGSPLASGVYFLVAVHPQARATLKVVKVE